jgi:hypothetical protein
MPERELAAIISAVTELYGSEQARLSAEEWLEEVVLMDNFPGSRTRPTTSDRVAGGARNCSLRSPAKSASPC